MLPQPPILLITDRSQARAPLPEVVAAALEGGCRWISVREKDLPQAEQIALARALLSLAFAFGGRVTLHGAFDLAVEAGVDGVHLPAGSDVGQARSRLGPGALIGLSTHTLAEVAGADARRLDYLIASPAFETRSKPGYGPALGEAGLRERVAVTSVPVLALGGIEPETIAPCRVAGVAGIAVMGAVMRAADPAHEMRALCRAWALGEGQS
ncbi:thiamine phosphate synthase [Roseixanthobacter pseudopolyaromaticivorans]|uniref:thiamine phosphate synthase n=1 Tax=Xanthobacteraceae TaxID=335928 RepID=UPI00372A34DA